MAASFPSSAEKVVRRTTRAADPAGTDDRVAGGALGGASVAGQDDVLGEQRFELVGRAREQRLEEGVAADPSYQRIWLTLGYVNSQLGNREKARAALQKAADMDSGNNVGQSALSMLDELD